MKYAWKRFFTEAGRVERPVYQSKLCSDGSVEVKIVGYDNIQDQINSHRDSCSIELIIQRCSRGDFSGLEARQGAYIDVTAYPKTQAEILQKVIDGKNLFNSLSKEVREKFGNDFNRWFVETGSAEWFDKMGVKGDKPSAEILVDKSASDDKEDVNEQKH